MFDRLARLLHPAFLLALAALVVNDHVLKEAMPSVLTGKLSDVAGLIVLPVLLTSLFRIRSRQLVWSLHLAVGVAFAVLQFVPESALWALGLSVQHTPDSTDLLALAILPFGVRMSLAEPRQLVWMRPALANAVGLVAVGAVLATSPPRAPFVVDSVPVLEAATAGDALVALESRLNALGFALHAPRVLPYEEWIALQSNWQDGDEARARHADVSETIRENRARGQLEYHVTVPADVCAEVPPAATLELDLFTQWDAGSNELAVVVYEVDYGAGDWDYADDAVREEGRRLVTVCVMEPLLESPR